MGTRRDYLRRVVPALAGFVLGAVLSRLFRGTWDWATLAGILFGMVIIMLVSLGRARAEKT
jgi:hypothetical protein